MTAASVTPAAPKRRLRDRLPVVHQLRQSVGLQRGMLVAGLVMMAVFIILAIFAPLLAPYGFAQRSDAEGGFGSQQPPSAEHWFGTTVGGYDVLSRVIYGAQTALLVVVIAVVLSLFIGVALGLFINGLVPGIPVTVAVACATLGYVLAISRSGWLAIFIAGAIAGSPAIFGLLCLAILPAWLVVSRAPRMIVVDADGART